MQARRWWVVGLHKIVEKLAAFACGGILACEAPPLPRCSELTAKADWPAAERVCGASFEKHRSAADGVELALALLYQERFEEVTSLSAALQRLKPSGTVRARLEWITGAAFARLKQPENARAHLRRVLELTEAEGASTRLRARAASELAGVEWEEGSYAAAHKYLNRATELAAAAGDHGLATYARVRLVDILRVEGDLSSAERELSQLARTAEAQPDKVEFLLKLGIAYNDLGMEELARAPLSQALELERASLTPRASVIASILLNLSWVERHSGAALKALEYVDEAERAGGNSMDIHLNRGLALREAGRLREAATSLAAAQAAGPSGDWVWWLFFNRAEVDVLLGEATSAEKNFRLAITAIEQLRTHAAATAPAVSVRQREVYTGLIGLLAQQQRWTAVLEVLLQLDAANLSQLLAPLTAEMRRPADGEQRALAAPRLAAQPPLASMTQLLEAWKARPLIILVPGAERMWRIELVGGAIVGEQIGTSRAYEEAAMRLERDPTSWKDGLLVGEGLRLERSTEKSGPTTPVDVLFVGQVGRVALSALRDASGLLRDRYALSRVRRLTPPPPSPPATGPAVILGDPGADLPQARLEAQHVAAVLGVAPLLHAQASSAALAEARGARVLHIAAHTVVVEGRPALQLADRAVPLDELRALRPAPRLVVLGTCGSASARDEDAWGSLASAFLDAGSEEVLATTQSVPDEDGRLVVEEFYRQGGLADPARALAAAQRALDARIPASRLAAFVILRAPPPRRDVAPTPSPVHRDGLNTSDRSLMSIPSKRK